MRELAVDKLIEKVSRRRGTILFANTILLFDYFKHHMFSTKQKIHYRRVNATQTLHVKQRGRVNCASNRRSGGYDLSFGDESSQKTRLTSIHFNEVFGIFPSHS